MLMLSIQARLLLDLQTLAIQSANTKRRPRNAVRTALLTHDATEKFGSDDSRD